MPTKNFMPLTAELFKLIFSSNDKADELQEISENISTEQLMMLDKVKSQFSAVCDLNEIPLVEEGPIVEMVEEVNAESFLTAGLLGIVAGLAGLTGLGIYFRNKFANKSEKENSAKIEETPEEEITPVTIDIQKNESQYENTCLDSEVKSEDALKPVTVDVNEVQKSESKHKNTCLDSDSTLEYTLIPRETSAGKAAFKVGASSNSSFSFKSSYNYKSISSINSDDKSEKLKENHKVNQSATPKIPMQTFLNNLFNYFQSNQDKSEAFFMESLVISRENLTGLKAVADGFESKDRYLETIVKNHAKNEKVKEILTFLGLSKDGFVCDRYDFLSNAFQMEGPKNRM